MHCQDAPCEKAAKNHAVTRRNDGIVLIDPEKAKGQKQLVDACPYHAIYWNKEEKLPQKCTLCAHWLDEGYKEPRCVEICPTEALTFGDLEDPDSAVMKKLVHEAVVLEPGDDELKPLIKYLNIPGMLVAGTIFRPDVKECAKGAKVTLSGNGTVKSTQANGFGDFEFENLPKDKDYTLKIEQTGYEPWETKLSTNDHWVDGNIQLKKQ
jgi:Fe-S-cluster-containing dehydrogenase component